MVLRLLNSHSEPPPALPETVRRPPPLPVLLATVALAVPAFAGAAAAQSGQLTVAPTSLELRVGQTGHLEATVMRPDGTTDEGARVLFFSLDPADVSVSHTGVVQAHRAGDHLLVALSPAAGTTPGFTRPEDPGIRVEIPVRILPSELASLRFVDLPEQVFVGASVPLRLIAEDAGAEPRDVRPQLTAAPGENAAVSAFGPLFEGTYHAHPFYDRPRPPTYAGDAAGILRALRPGPVAVTAVLGELLAEAQVEVIPNPAAAIALEAAVDGSPLAGRVRTGDVVRFTASVEDAGGAAVADAPVRFSLESHPDPSRYDTVGAGAPAQVLADGRFVAEQAGLYVVRASSGSASAERAVTVVPREVGQAMAFVGHAPVRDRATSDLWIWRAATAGTTRARHLERRRPRALLRRDRPLRHAPDLRGPGGRPHGERREGLRRRPDRGHHPGGGLEPPERVRDP